MARSAIHLACRQRFACDFVSLVEQQQFLNVQLQFVRLQGEVCQTIDIGVKTRSAAHSMALESVYLLRRFCFGVNDVRLGDRFLIS